MNGIQSPHVPLLRPAGSCLLLFAVALSGCNSAAPPAPKSNKAAAALQTEVIAVQPRRWPVVVRTQGSLAADEVSVVGARVTGRVDKVHVDLGDVVHAGDPLVTLNQVEFSLLVSQAEAQLNQAMAAVGLQPGAKVSSLNPTDAPPVRQERALWDEAQGNLKRGRRFQAGNVITEAELDQLAAAERVASARYASSLNSVQEKISLIGVRQAELDLAREHLENSVFKAPFDGLIQQRQVAPGTYVQIGDPVATLVRTNPLRFRGAMPERHSQQLKLGQEVELRIESLPAPRTVRVTRISPGLDLLSRALLFEAEVENPDGRLRSGLFAEAKVVLNPNAESIVVPESALLEFAGTQKVWKVTDGMAGESEVLLGQRRPEGVEVLQGLAAGDVILLNAAVGRVARVTPMQGSLDVASKQPQGQGASSSAGGSPLDPTVKPRSGSTSTSLD